MNIIILGAGRVGQSVAESLVSEHNDITVIDTDPQRLRHLQDRLDLRGVVGNGIQPSVLAQAGARDADMLIGCASADETNLVVCKVAHDVFHIPTRIARLRSPEFERDSALLSATGFAVNEVICPEASVTAYIRQLIEFPQALQVMKLAQGLLSLMAVRAVLGGRLVGHTLEEIPSLMPELQARVVAIYRHDKALQQLDGRTRLTADDEVLVLAPTAQIRTALGALRPAETRPVRRLMVAGGGKVGLRLARELCQSHDLKLIEQDRARCDYLATQVPASTLVLHGDCTDEDLLHDEHVHEMDLFAALTDDDEDNIMACLLAKRMGARRVLALINRGAYADLVQGTKIDIAISPASAVIGELLAHVRHGDVQAVHSLRRGAAEAIEAVVRGDARSSRLVGRRIDQIKLPPGVQIGAVVRGLHTPEGPPPQVLMAHHDTRIEALDHVILFVPRKRMVRDVEKLLQVHATFF